jgi:N-glycosylase/DNA lyase
MTAAPVIEKIENAVRAVNHELDNNSGKNWTGLSEEELFSELASCIIGSRITFEKAKNVSELLKRNELLTPQGLIEQPRTYEKRIHSILREQKCLYAKSKARYIVSTSISIYSNKHTSIRKILETANDQYAARDILVELCLGIGFKQASLFLRNIHYADDLAILDTHVINYMRLMGLEDDVGQGLTQRMYLSYEDRLRKYSEKFNTSVAQLDISIWVVMRTISREFRWML